MGSVEMEVKIRGEPGRDDTSASVSLMRLNPTKARDYHSDFKTIGWSIRVIPRKFFALRVAEISTQKNRQSSYSLLMQVKHL